MDFRGSGLIIGVYVVLAGIVAGVVGGSLLLWRRDSQTLAALQLEPDAGARGTGGRGSVDDAYLFQRQEAFAEAAQRIKQLETLLQRKTDLLNRRTELLQQRSREYDALQEQADRYLMALVEELSQQAASTNTPDGKANADDPKTRQGTEARVAMQTEMDRMREDLEMSEMAEMALEAELEQVRQQLVASRDRLTEAELREFLGDPAAARRPLATEALVRVGPEAVNALIVSLRDERAEIRLWAAEVLAEMGPVARPAVASLRTAAQDTDNRVRAAARQALASVNAVEP
jgi:HEAT repeat protein